MNDMIFETVRDVWIRQREVEQLDAVRILQRLRLENLPHGPRLAGMLGSLNFRLEGFDWAQDPLHLNPASRRFCREWHSLWPHWLYFCTLENQTLWRLLQCCRVPPPTVPGPARNFELLRLVMADFVPLNTLLARAQIPEAIADKRRQEVFDYFRLPFGSADLEAAPLLHPRQPRPRKRHFPPTGPAHSCRSSNIVQVRFS